MADATFVSLKNCTIQSAFDSKYKTSMQSVLVDAIKKGIDSTSDFASTNPHPADKDAKTFVLNISGSLTKDDKAKPPRVKAHLDVTALLTGKGSSGQQFKGDANSITETTAKIDEDVKFVVKEAAKALTADKGKMTAAMRKLLQP